MRANLSFRAALKATPAVLAAALGLSAAPDAARASTISSSGFTLTGSFITYTPDPSLNAFGAFVEFPGGAPVTFDGVGGAPLHWSSVTRHRQPLLSEAAYMNRI